MCVCVFCLLCGYSYDALVLRSLSGCLALGAVVWTFIIWVNKLTDECRDLYDDKYHSLWIYYQVSFWLVVAGLAGLGLILYCLLIALLFGTLKKPEL